MIKVEIKPALLKVLPLIKVNCDSDIIVDKNDLLYISDVLPTFAHALGYSDNYIPATQFQEKRWSQTVEDEIWELFNYIKNNVNNIISILLFTAETGIKCGTYKSTNKLSGIWKFEEFNNLNEESWEKD
jgi:hypothetical protein